MESLLVIYITCPSYEEAESLSRKILEEKLAACCNIINGVQSFFWWEGEIDQAEEALMIVKSQKSRLKELVEFVQMYHPYDVPEIIALPIVGGSQDYLKWVKEESTDEWK